MEQATIVVFLNCTSKTQHNRNNRMWRQGNKVNRSGDELFLPPPARDSHVLCRKCVGLWLPCVTCLDNRAAYGPSGIFRQTYGIKQTSAG